jgi:hypothetical protein
MTRNGGVSAAVAPRPRATAMINPRSDNHHTPLMTRIIITTIHSLSRPHPPFPSTRRCHVVALPTNSPAHLAGTDAVYIRAPSLRDAPTTARPTPLPFPPLPSPQTAPRCKRKETTEAGERGEDFSDSAAATYPAPRERDRAAAALFPSLPSDMTPHLPAVSSSSTTTTSRAAAAAHHLLDAAAAPPSSPHQYRRRRRRRVLGCLRPRAASVRCCAAAARAAEATTRVFVVSDLHTDYPENMEWVRRLPAQVGAGEGRGVDALVVAGDVAETRDNFARTMEVLRERFAAVFYVPGNHDLWLRREGGLYVSVHFLASPTFLDAFLSCAASKVFDEMPWHSYYGICCAV